jgi:hypothetical protein
MKLNCIGVRWSNLLPAVVLPVLFTCLTGCKDVGTENNYIAKPIEEDHSTITDPYARWQAYGLTSYVIEQENSCFCPYGAEMCKVYVRDNKIVDVIKKSDGKSIYAEMPRRYKTVEELFALAGSIHPDSVASLVIQYDARFGYPSVIAVDFSIQMSDEEYAYRSQNIERLLN